MKKTAVIIIITLIFVKPVYTSTVFGNYESYFDNYVTSFHQWTGGLRIENIKSNLLFDISYQRINSNGGLNGLIFPEFSNSAKFHTSIQITKKSPTIDFSTGLDNSFKTVSFFFSPSVSYPITIQNVSFKLGGLYRYGYYDATPIVSSLHIPTHSWGSSIKFSRKNFGAEISFGQDYIDQIELAQYRQFIQDTSFFSTYYNLIEPAIHVVPVTIDPIPANRIDKVSAYFFGPIVPWLYAGGYIEFQNAQQNLFVLLDDTVSADNHSSFFFDYLPYKTPSKRFESGVSVSILMQPGKIFEQFKLEGKIPLFSTGMYRGFYVPEDQNLLNGFESFHYRTGGLAPLELGSTIVLNFRNLFTTELNYTFKAEPYTSYSFFNSNESYKSNIIKLSVSKKM